MWEILTLAVLSEIGSIGLVVVYAGTARFGRSKAIFFLIEKKLLKFFD